MIEVLKRQKVVEGPVVEKPIERVVEKEVVVVKKVEEPKKEIKIEPTPPPVEDTHKLSKEAIETIDRYELAFENLASEMQTLC